MLPVMLELKKLDGGRAFVLCSQNAKVLCVEAQDSNRGFILGSSE